jgi:hypothetical protein
MVRVKHRYLLIDILYPPSDLPNAVSKDQQRSKYEKQIHLQIHRPTSDELTPQVLARMVRQSVGELFGDWGMGKLGGAGIGGVSG